MKKYSYILDACFVINFLRDSNYVDYLDILNKDKLYIPERVFKEIKGKNTPKYQFKRIVTNVKVKDKQLESLFEDPNGDNEDKSLAVLAKNLEEKGQIPMIITDDSNIEKHIDELNLIETGIIVGEHFLDIVYEYSNIEKGLEALKTEYKDNADESLLYRGKKKREKDIFDIWEKSRKNKDEILEEYRKEKGNPLSLKKGQLTIFPTYLINFLYEKKIRDNLYNAEKFLEYDKEELQVVDSEYLKKLEMASQGINQISRGVEIGQELINSSLEFTKNAVKAEELDTIYEDLRNYIEYLKDYQKGIDDKEWQKFLEVLVKRLEIPFKYDEAWKSHWDYEDPYDEGAFTILIDKLNDAKENCEYIQKNCNIKGLKNLAFVWSKILDGHIYRAKAWAPKSWEERIENLKEGQESFQNSLKEKYEKEFPLWINRDVIYAYSKLIKAEKLWEISENELENKGKELEKKKEACNVIKNINLDFVKSMYFDFLSQVRQLEEFKHFENGDVKKGYEKLKEAIKLSENSLKIKRKLNKEIHESEIENLDNMKKAEKQLSKHEDMKIV